MFALCEETIMTDCKIQYRKTQDKCKRFVNIKYFNFLKNLQLVRI